MGPLSRLFFLIPMSVSMNPVFLALDALFTRYMNLHQMEKDRLPSVSFDPPWPSLCTEIAGNEPSDTVLFWRPIERKGSDLFISLESALELKFHPDVDAFYGAFWSNGLSVEFNELPFNLIQIWNEEDEENLKQNLLGHAFAKRKNRLPMSWFIGATSGNDVICIDQESGQVVLEKPGYKAHEVLAANLEAFLIGLKPTMDDYNA